MALKQKSSNYYIKIALDGNYTIYDSEKARLDEKKVTPAIKVNQKYYELIKTLSANSEQLYYDPSAKQFVEELEMEHKRYCQNYQAKITSEKYPLMKKYIKDVDKSIPKVITKGKLGVIGSTLEEVYDFVKRCKIFGETEDC